MTGWPPPQKIEGKKVPSLPAFITRAGKGRRLGRDGSFSFGPDSFDSLASPQPPGSNRRMQRKCYQDQLPVVNSAGAARKSVFGLRFHFSAAQLAKPFSLDLLPRGPERKGRFQGGGREGTAAVLYYCRALLAWEESGDFSF